MALTATIYTFDIQLTDVERSVYETLDLRVARHPSETEASVITRVLAYCLEYAEGIGFSKGISDPEDPAIAVRDLTGAIRTWVDVGAPDASRLHKAAKIARRVVVYTHRDPAQLIRQWSAERIYRSGDIELYSVPRSLLDPLVAQLARRMSIAIAISGKDLFISLGDKTIEGAVVRHPLTAAV